MHWGRGDNDKVYKSQTSKLNLQSRLEIILPLETWSSRSRRKQSEWPVFHLAHWAGKWAREDRQSRVFEVNRGLGWDFFCPRASSPWSLPPEGPLELPPASPPLTPCGQPQKLSPWCTGEGGGEGRWHRQVPQSPSPLVILPESR